MLVQYNPRQLVLTPSTSKFCSFFTIPWIKVMKVKVVTVLLLVRKPCSGILCHFDPKGKLAPPHPTQPLDQIIIIIVII